VFRSNKRGGNGDKKGGSIERNKKKKRMASLTSKRGTCCQFLGEEIDWTRAAISREENTPSVVRGEPESSIRKRCPAKKGRWTETTKGFTHEGQMGEARGGGRARMENRRPEGGRFCEP